MRPDVDRISLAAGALTIVIGVVMMLDQSSNIELSGGILAALFVGAFGLILLLSGLFEDR
jgi:hypothetical protein